jgi:hypothetical protein
MIKHAQMPGFRLTEIFQVLAIWLEDKITVEQKRSTLVGKLAQPKAKKQALGELKAGLSIQLTKLAKIMTMHFECS